METAMLDPETALCQGPPHAGPDVPLILDAALPAMQAALTAAGWHLANDEPVGMTAARCRDQIIVSRSCRNGPRVPNLHCPIDTACSQTLAIRAKGHAGHRVGVPV